MNHPSDFPQLRVMAPDQADAESVLWIALDNLGAFIESGHAAPNQLPSCQSLEIVLPANRVSSLIVPLPSAARRHTKQILAQALEDRLLGGLESAHYVLGEQKDDQAQVWITDKAWLGTILQRLAQRPADRVSVEYEFLPTVESGLVCAQGDNYCYFRDSNGRYACVDSVDTLSALYPEHTVQTIERPLQHPAITSRTNLLCGNFAKKTSFSIHRADYRPSLSWLVLLAVALLIQQGLHWQSLASRETRLKQEIRQTFAAAFPGTPIVDPFLQWQSQQGSNAESINKDALNLASKIADGMQAPLPPRSLEVRDGVVRIVIREQESAAARAAVEKLGLPFEFAPVEAGTVRLEIRPKR